VQVKIKKGGRKRRAVHRGRKPSKLGITGFVTKKSLQLIAEERANKKYPNCEVLNSYWLAEDGRHKWFEVILIDRTNPSILSDKEALKVVKRKKRVLRGLTKSGRKMRGLL
jgi:large subunit ribosomal protein L15e